jgi:hypothetical protein
MNETCSVAEGRCVRPGACPSARDLAALCNAGCFCSRLDRTRLMALLSDAAADEASTERLLAERPTLFSDFPVFLSRGDFDAMTAVAKAIEYAAAQLRPVGSSGPRGADRIPDFPTAGIMMGYDFHIGEGAPRLIEINTNAGGAFLNARAAKAYGACCDLSGRLFDGAGASGFEQRIAAMIAREWSRQRGERPLRTIAIVDDAPQSQYLYPDFLLARALFTRLGYGCVIADVSELSCADGVLSCGGMPVDFVYNRLVDFTLQQPSSAALRSAWLSDAAVVSPSPAHHAALADKRIMSLLSDPATTEDLGLSVDQRAALATIPRAQALTRDNAEALWRERSGLFFKPFAGYGARAVYRGASVSRTVFDRLADGGYIAQAYAEPSDRTVLIAGETRRMKLDVRMYAYAGEPLLFAARLYRGQATNFRTEGGGFAPVLFLDDAGS